MMNHDSDGVTVQPTDSAEIVERMISSVRFEQFPILADYLAFKFAFPAMRNELLEHAHEIQYSILRRALAGKEAYTVLHPYPVSLVKLYEAMVPYIELQVSERVLPIASVGRQ